VSVSSYQSQVDRLTKEIADLRAKLATENSKVADYRSRTRRASEAMTRASSVSTMQTKAREVERYGKSAVDYEKRAAQIEKQIATKQASLTSAQRSLDRAVRQQQQQETRDAERRRRDELAHIQELERQRRAVLDWPTDLHVRPSPVAGNGPPAAHPFNPPKDFNERYDVCLSFAGEQRGYVELVAQGLKAEGFAVFYDEDDEIKARLWGRDLTEYLDYVYRRGSRVCVMFISVEYASKEWTRMERRSALDRAVSEASEYILPVRFDDTELPGLRPSIGYLDVREIAPATLVDFVVRKLRETP
jgi:hypothetical protein